MLAEKGSTGGNSTSDAPNNRPERPEPKRSSQHSSSSSSASPTNGFNNKESIQGARGAYTKEQEDGAQRIIAAAKRDHYEVFII